MKNLKKLSTICISTLIIGGCSSVPTVELHDTLIVRSTPEQAEVFVKRIDQAFTEFELGANKSKLVTHDNFFIPRETIPVEDEQPATEITALYDQAPGKFTLQKLGTYIVSIQKEGYQTQEHIVTDKLTAGEVAGNLAKTAGTVAGGGLLTLLTGPIGLVVLAASAAKKGANMKSGKNKELFPNPLDVVLEGQ